MVSFTRSQNSKHSLGVGLLHNVKWITFIAVGLDSNDSGTTKEWHLLAEGNDSLEIFMENGKLDKNRIYKNMKTLHAIYKLENKFDAIDIYVLFGTDKIRDMSRERSNEILMMP